jgi:hypothetical protein
MASKLSREESLIDLRDVPVGERNKEIARQLSLVETDREKDAQDKKIMPDLSQISGSICNWTGLAELARRYMDEGGGGWVFRGQTFPHPLKPKIGRQDSRKDPVTNAPLPHDLSDEGWILEEFKRRSRPYLSHTPQGDMEWLAIAQHHGMPTRLLDWTESFLAAAYFAVAKAGSDGPAMIYAFQGDSLLSSKDDPLAVRKDGLYRPPHITPRIPAQQGLFTVHADPAAEYSPRGLERWVIEAGVCYNIKKQLHLCGMNESVLFPDIDGLANYLGWLYKRPTSSRRVGRN